jgi:hypothetical protein
LRQSGSTGERGVELRETSQVETGAQGLERGAGGVQLTLCSAPFTLCE